MNRQQRRRLQRQREAVQELSKEEVSKVIQFVTMQYGAVVALCLKDKLGFGKVRAQRFLSDVEEMFDSIEQGYLTLDDVLQTVKDELGVSFNG